MEEIRNRMIGELAATSLVTALLATVAVTLLASPPKALLEAENDAIPFTYCVVTAAALFCNIANVTYSTLLTTTVNLLVEDGDVTKWFIKKHAALATFWNFVLFDFSILLPLVSIVMFSSYTYSFAAGYVLVALCTVIFAISVAVWLWADYQRWFKLRDLAKARTQERLVHPV
eukprot:CAMPEP_0202372116 /NCGR_PEP_ID=MMETSP1127-20130417/3375_1 /ASSEMBLY_ACC=CAM_ASM_000462 /TAXON_ID=3047 /ORGANISM="Dunaliella tertiolecta, Strain CCMP1320" /LENGTH=172 /DNA_ID=CAMNT_0048968559 /DNA_START=258 /DNA_END=776 /DNA_ORIENTATION=+